MTQEITQYEIILEGIRAMATAFNTTFNNISLYHGGQFYWWRKPEYQEKTSILEEIIEFIWNDTGDKPVWN